MNKRIAAFVSLVSLFPLNQPLMIGLGTVLTSASVMVFVPAKAKAERVYSYLNSGSKKAGKGDYIGAIAEYTKGLEVNPRDASLYLNRGNAKTQLKDYAGAINDYTKAIELNPKWTPLAYTGRGYAKYLAKDYQESIADYRKAIELYPRNPNAYFKIGIVKYALNDYQGAIDNYTKALEINRFDGFLKSLRSDRRDASFDDVERKEVYYGRYKNNRKYIQEMAIYIANRGMAKLKLDDFSGAISDFNKAIEIDPGFSDFFHKRGVAKKLNGDLKGACSDWREVSIRGHKAAAKSLRNEC